MEHDKLYIGSETTKTNNKWLIENHKHPSIDKLIDIYGEEPLLNAGIIGGYRSRFMMFLSMLIVVFDNYKDDYTDIPALNWLLRGNESILVSHQ